MDDINMQDPQDQDSQDLSLLNNDAVIFTCPNCGNLSRDEVVFLCNHCKQEELIYKEGMYICPSCLVPGKNFQCMNCDSTDVTMTENTSSK